MRFLATFGEFLGVLASVGECWRFLCDFFSEFWRVFESLASFDELLAIFGERWRFFAEFLPSS